MTVHNWIDTGVLLLAAVCSTLFVVVYTYRTSWWREEHRAHLGFFTLNLALLFWTYVFRAAVDPGTFSWIRTVLFASVGANVVWRLTLLFRSKRSDAAREGREDQYQGEQ